MIARDPGDDESRRPGRWVIGQERRAGVGEIDAGCDLRPAEVHAAPDGRGYGVDPMTLRISLGRA